MREHVHRLYGCHLVVRIESLQVSCLSGRVAAYVYDALRVGTQYGVNNV